MSPAATSEEKEKKYISPPEVTLWLKGIMMDPEATTLISFLRKRRYEAVFPGVFTLALYSRLRFS